MNEGPTLHATLDNPPVAFEGFTHRQERWISQLLEEIGLPTTGFDKCHGRVFSKEAPLWALGQFSRVRREISLSGLEFGLNIVASARSLTHEVGRVLVHEIGHSMGPLNPAVFYFGLRKNPQQFDTLPENGWVKKELAKFDEEKADLLADAVIKSADQAYRTGVYLNWYQHSILLAARALKLAHVVGLIPENFYKNKADRSSEETEAILIEMRFANPKKLLRVDKAQCARFPETVNTDSLLRWKEKPENPIPPFALANEIIRAVTGKTDEEIEASVQAYQKFIKKNPFPIF